MIPTGALIEDLQRVHREEGKCSYFTYVLAGQYSGTTVLERFGKWSHALGVAGLPLNKIGRPRGRKQ